MLQEKVLAGKYKDYAIVYDHIKNMTGDDVYFNNFTVKTFELADMSKGSIWEGVLTATARSAAGQDDKEQRLISVEWRDGDRSLLQINSMTCKRLMESLFGYIPKELMEKETLHKKKPKSHANFYVIGGILVIVIVIAKFLFFS
ncbi:MAG: hypothetical protein AAGU75_03405 [Bacillota bacterium]